MFTRDRSQMDPTLSWNGPFLFTRHRSAYQRQVTRNVSTMRSLLNRSKKSSCFYQLSTRRIHVEAFKIAPKKAKSIEEGDKTFSLADDELSLELFLFLFARKLRESDSKFVSSFSALMDNCINVTAIWRTVSCLKAVKPRSMLTKTATICLFTSRPKYDKFN